MNKKNNTGKMDKWTKEDWEKTVMANAFSSYGMIANSAGLLLAEIKMRDPSITEDELDKKLVDNIGGLSGFQASIAYKICDKIVDTEWLRKQQEDDKYD